ncbi:PDZ domain-containing protein [Paraburkholderia phytofirmans]|uniref:PDZ domain-containing protein n=1 Tax=Paraburkholderia phytofirmans TaxID=261302 RepID=UPI0038B73287
MLAQSGSGECARRVTGSGWSVAAPSAPAELAGVKRGDQITTIDGRSTAEMSLIQIAGLIPGQPAISVKLGIEREGRRLALTAERKAIVVEAD